MSALTSLLVCEWGISVALDTDREPCGNQAVQRMTLHQDDEPFTVKVCPLHRDLLLAHTDPHEGEVTS